MPIGSALAFNIEQHLAVEFAQGAADGPIKKAIMRSPGGLAGAHHNAAARIRDSIFAKASIDDLLHEWRDTPEMIEVGKIAIANAILGGERKSVLGPTATSDPDKASAAVRALRECWLSYLVQNLQSQRPRRDLEGVFSEVGFITFNYDRCIEQYLYWAFQNVAGLNPGNAALAVGRIPIVHVYGSLGSLPYAAGESLDLEFGSDATIHQSVWRRIKTYTEEDHDRDSLSSIHALFRNAARIVFLGMGFHQQNMDLLLKDGPIRGDCDLWGTTQNLTKQRLKQVHNYFDHPARKRPQFEDIGCGEFFKSFGPAFLQNY
jgi:hypothetical protein